MFDGTYQSEGVMNRVWAPFDPEFDRSGRMFLGGIFVLLAGLICVALSGWSIWAAEAQRTWPTTPARVKDAFAWAGGIRLIVIYSHNGTTVRREVAAAGSAQNASQARAAYPINSNVNLHVHPDDPYRITTQPGVHDRHTIWIMSSVVVALIGAVIMLPGIRMMLFYGRRPGPHAIDAGAWEARISRRRRRSRVRWT